jgi:hypothetical protein
MSNKAEQLALLQKKLSMTKTKLGKAVLEKKIEKLKSEMGSSKNAKKEVTEAKKKVSQLSISELKKKPEFKFLKKMKKGNIEDDQKRVAKPKGWRFKGKGKYRKPTASEIVAGKKRGNVYYEARNRHSDVSRIVRLKEGGGVGSFPFIKFEDAQEGMKKINKGELPKFFSYVEKEKTLYYLPNITKEWVKLKSFATKEKAIEWVKDNLKAEGFATGGGVKGSKLVFSEKPKITLINKKKYTFSHGEETWYDIAVNGLEWFGSKVEFKGSYFGKATPYYWINLYSISEDIESKLKRKYNTTDELKKDVANVLMGESYSESKSIGINGRIYIPASKYANGGGVENEKSLRHFILEQVSSGMIANKVPYSDYKTIDEIKFTALQILNRDGDREYSMKSFSDLIQEALLEYEENKYENKFDNGGGVGLSSNAQKVLDRMVKAKVNRYMVHDFTVKRYADDLKIKLSKEEIQKVAEIYSTNPKYSFDFDKKYATGGSLSEPHRNEIMKSGGKVEQYPELRKIADKIADETAIKINNSVKTVSSKMPYKAQWVLEEVVRELESRI